MAIVDNNILSSLAKIDRLALLSSVFETVETIPSVIDELDRAEVDGYEFVTRIDAVKSYKNGWLEIATPTGAELKLADELRDHALSVTRVTSPSPGTSRQRLSGRIEKRSMN